VQKLGIPIVTLGTVAIIASCQNRAIRTCLDLLDAEEYEAASGQCEAIYMETKNPLAGAAAARAQRALGNCDEVLGWLEKLKGSEVEADLWSLAAEVYLERRDLEPAKQAYEQELEFRRESGDHSKSSKSYYGLFYASWLMDDHRSAIEFLHESYKEASLAKDQQMQAMAIHALVSPLYMLGDLEGAARALEKANEVVPADDRRNQALLLNMEGIIRASQKRTSLARDAFERSLEMGSEIDNRGMHRSIHLNLVESNLELGQLDAAERHLDAAWEFAEPEGRNRTGLLFYTGLVDQERRLPDKAAGSFRTALEQNPTADWAWKLEYHLGLAEQAQGRQAQAARAYQRSIEKVEEMRRSLEIDEFKSWMLDEKRKPYEALFCLQTRDGHAESALETLERAQARTFLDAFVHAATAVETPTEATWKPEFAADRVDELRELLPRMSASPMVANRPIDTILHAVRNRHVLLYFEAAEDMWLVTVAKGNVRVQRLEASAASVRDLVDQFLAHPDQTEAATKLGQILLPDGSVPEQKSLLHIAVDGSLGHLPFASLRRKERYLVEDHVITYIPSLNALVAIEETARTPFQQPIVLGDPLGDLPSAALEAEEVARHLEAPLCTVGCATSHKLSEASSAAVLHLATHTGLGPRGPWLALSDGQVAAQTILTGRVHPRLVVLASCASAARRGKEMWGSLAAVFLAAGSQSVFASLWSIEDEPTRDFVMRFYRQGGNLDAAGALARTQRDYISQGKAPSEWASFVVFGSKSDHDTSIKRRES
jgi:CHAT domain-containing protein